MDPPGDHIEEDQREGDEDDDQSVGRDDESPPEEDDAEDDYDDNDDTKEDDEQPPDPTPPRTADPIHDFQPDYAKANSLPFYVLCRRLDVLLQQRLSKDRQSREELFHYLFPNQLRQYIGQGSWFPLLRLIMPDIDTSRPHTGLKEKTIALAWAEALGLAPHSPSYLRILHYSDPTYFETVGTAGVGDLSSVIYNEMQRRTGDEQSGLTVGHINDLLDALVKLKTTARGNHDWRNTNTANTTNKPSNLKQHRRQWVETLLHKNLSALEHKWVVRILLQKVEIGFSYKTILEHWRPGAMQLYRMNNNLKSVCTTLCNPYWIQQEIQRQEEQQQGQGTV
jgi:DNA ligase-4